MVALTLLREVHARGVDYRQIAVRAGVDPSLISHCLAGRRKLSPRVLLAASELLAEQHEQRGRELEALSRALRAVAEQPAHQPDGVAVGG